MRTVQRSPFLFIGGFDSSALCRSRRAPSHECLLFIAKIDFDTAENEPCKVCPLSAYRSPRSSKTADLATVLTERNGSFLEVPQKFLRCLLIHGQVLNLIDPMRMYRILAYYFRKNLRTAATVRLVVVDERNSGFPSSAYNMR